MVPSRLIARPNNGAGNGTRTRDIQLGKLTLYQLSYARSGKSQLYHAFWQSSKATSSLKALLEQLFQEVDREHNSEAGSALRRAVVFLF